jgi:uncharacterized membrane protein YbjE (DUF340 family)
MIFTSKFRALGIVIIIGTLITGVVYRWASIPNSIYTKTLLIDLFIVGLALYAFSKDKIEDERILAIRYKSLAGALILSIIYCLVVSVLNVVMGDFQLSGQELIIIALIIYILCFTFLKRLDNNESID